MNSAAMALPPDLPVGVSVNHLRMHRDERGVFTELFRESWLDGARFLQWNGVISAAGVLRGVHVHLRHADYLVVLQGRGLFGLRDLRPGSPTEGLVAMVELEGNAQATLRIPPGVAHGFYFLEPSLHVYAVSHYWDMADELGCRFDDPALGIAWPNALPMLSERDRNLPPLADILPRIPAFAQPV